MMRAFISFQLSSSLWRWKCEYKRTMNSTGSRRRVLKMRHIWQNEIQSLINTCAYHMFTQTICAFAHAYNERLKNKRPDINFCWHFRRSEGFRVLINTGLLCTFLRYRKGLPWSLTLVGCSFALTYIFGRRVSPYNLRKCHRQIVLHAFTFLLLRGSFICMSLPVAFTSILHLWGMCSLFISLALEPLTKNTMW